MLKTGPRSLIRDCDAQAVIELALLMPLFILTSFGTFECGMALMNYVNATYAIRVASRYASIHSSSSLSPATTAQIQSIVASNIFVANVTSGNVYVTYSTLSGGTGGNNVGSLVGVRIVWGQNLNIPFYGKSNFNVNSQTYRVITQ